MSILSNELLRDEYNGVKDGDVAAMLNKLPSAEPRKVPVAELLNGAYQTGMYSRLLAASQKALPDNVYGELMALLNLVNGPIHEIDLTSAAAQRMIGTLTQAGLVTTEEVALIGQLGYSQPPSRAQELGLGEVTAEDVAAARGELAADETKATRDTGYAELRRQLLNGQQQALVWIQVRADGGYDVPTLAEALAQF